MSKSQHAAIAEHAYYLWLNEGRAHGKAEHHWAIAEKLLAADMPVVAKPKSKKAAAKAAPRAKARPTAMALHS